MYPCTNVNKFGSYFVSNVPRKLTGESGVPFTSTKLLKSLRSFISSSIIKKKLTKLCKLCFTEFYKGLLLEVITKNLQRPFRCRVLNSSQVLSIQCLGCILMLRITTEKHIICVWPKYKKASHTVRFFS